MTFPQNSEKNHAGKIAYHYQEAFHSGDGQRVVPSSQGRHGVSMGCCRGEVLAKLEGRSGAVFAAAFSPHGHRVVTAGKDGAALVWNTGQAKLIATLESHSAPVHSVAFSPDGQCVLAANDDGTAHLWDTAAGR